MLTEGKKRALRANTLINSGMDAKEVAKKCGYKNVNGMLGAISLNLPDNQPAARMAACTAEEHAQKHNGLRTNHTTADETPRSRRICEDEFKPSAKVYPVKEGLIIIAREMATVTYKPEKRTVHIHNNLCKNPSWLAFAGNDAIGGKVALVKALRQVSEAAAECAALIEGELRGGEQDVDHHAR